MPEKKLDAEATNAEALAKMKATAQQQRERFLAEVAKRAQRPWMLKHPNAAYAGRYENPLYGTIVIEERGEKLVASMANLLQSGVASAERVFEVLDTEEQTT